MYLQKFMVLMLLLSTQISKKERSIDFVVEKNFFSCPGSNMFLFRFPNGKLILHTGDFRGTPQLLAHPLLQPNQIDTIYLDTTLVHVIFS